MLESMGFVIFLVIVALVFDFLNGFHDSANSISTVVSTRVLSPKYAVIWAAFFNFAAVFFVGTAVAHTIGKGIIHIDIVDNLVILSALGGAIIWNIATWYYGLPSSSSHALIGGLVGSGVAAFGTKVVIFLGLLKVFLFIFLAPLIGFGICYIFSIFIIFLFRKSLR